MLTRAAEVPGPGDPDAAGMAEITLNAALGTVCASTSITNLTTPVAAPIHIGAAGILGPIFITLPTPPVGSSSNCVANVAPALIDAVVQNPSGFYANVHTVDYPAGAMRGQLALGVLAIASLTGVAAVPGPGEPDGTRMAVNTLNRSQQTVCYDLTVANVAASGPAVGCIPGEDRDPIGAILENPGGY